MDYLQYLKEYIDFKNYDEVCFKPCYKWITFNTLERVLYYLIQHSFKPCYKWITFNTKDRALYIF